jgi:TrmH family RNA methyltransferase
VIPPRVVLVRCAEPMNLGAVARAMKGCELSDLVLVSPRTADLVTARRVAVHAEDLLDAPRVVDRFAEAVGDCALVVGTTSRSVPGEAPLSPREVAALCARTPGRAALVFGGETSGLSNDDLARCHAISRIPAGAAQPSFNLAQAVLIYAYEWRVASALGSDAALDDAPRAQEREIERLGASLRELLGAAGFADPDRSRHGVVDLMRPLRRAGLLAQEARLWQAALALALRALRRP